MIALSYILTAVSGVLIGALLSRLLFGRHKAIEPQPAKSPYKVVPAVAAYERYAAKVEGREQNAALINPKPTRPENPFIAAIQRATRERHRF